MGSAWYLLGFLALLALALASGPAQGRDDELLEAARDGNRKLAVALVESGADVRQTGAQGETALHWAAFYGLHSLARLLIERGADVNAQVRNGSTALHQAAYKGRMELVELLVANGATLGVTNWEGLTATQFAQLNSHAEVVSYLVAHGGRADPTIAIDRRIDASQLVSASRRAGFWTSPDVQRRPADPGQRSTSLPGLSTRLGDLPPLILKVPDAGPAAARSLALTPDLELGRSRTKPPEPPQEPMQSQRSKSMWVQLGSFRTRARANNEWRNVIGAHEDLMKGFEPTITTTGIGDKGTFHRLLVGPLPDVDARRVCRDLKARQGDCLVIAEPGP